MDRADARALIEDLTQWSEAPALSVPEVDRLVDRARALDGAGLYPSDDGYVETFTEASVSQAVAEGFAIKAAKVAAQVDVKAGEVEAKRSQAVGALMAQGRRHGRVGVGSITLTTVIAEVGNGRRIL